MKRSLYFLLILISFSNIVQAQISAPSANASDVTQYPVFNETDDIFLFCSDDSLSEAGALTVTTDFEGTKTFLWEKYNEQTGSFELYFQESSDGQTSTISNLADGCYRSTITLGATTVIDRAWVFNNWTIVDGYITNSNCESFYLNGSFSTANLTYYDLSTNAPVIVLKDVEVEWTEGESKISSMLSWTYYSPPTENTTYTLNVYDKYECGTSFDVEYESIVTKAEFTADPMSGEAPLTVTFNNTSENGTSGYYEWFLYRDMYQIRDESEGSTEPVDSFIFDTPGISDELSYTYQNSGSYKVKLVSKHRYGDNLFCSDTFSLEDYIVVDTSFINVPNVFTPGTSPGVNDEFVVKFWSMKSLEINIYNRWGKRVHYWKSGNIEGFDDTMEESVWDGKINGRYASPGVYYYDVRGRGRDGEKRFKKGFVHLFRDKG